MKSQVEVTKDFVLNAPLPTHGDSYTVISHKFVIDNTKQMLANSGFIITHEMYRANNRGEVAQGIYHIKSINDNDPDSDLGMMFAWTNSYDKSIRFQCAIGAHVFACGNGMVCGELNYARKHTGTADEEIKMQISSQIKNAQKAFDRIKDDRDGLRNTPLSKKQQAELLGRMFFNEDLISPRQMSVVKDEMEKPSFDYQADQENAWAFYNHVTHSYKSVHPRAWLSDSKTFHDFMVANVLTGIGITPADTIDTNDTIEEEDQTTPYIDEDETEIIAEIPATQADVDQALNEGIAADGHTEASRENAELSIAASEEEEELPATQDHPDAHLVVENTEDIVEETSIEEDEIQMIDDDEDFDFEF
jgi:hypothetical protein